MEKEVLIHVKGLHMLDTQDGEEPIEIVVPGEYYFRNGSHYLRYEELLEDQGDPTINYIKISPRGMEVRKKGVVNTHMVFEQGKRTWHCIPLLLEPLRWGFPLPAWNFRKVTAGLI